MTDHADVAANRARARALPMFNEGVIPPERDRALASDDSGFMDVMRLLLRSWPYIRPQLLGHWWYPGPGGGVRPEVADLVSGEGYQFGYAPFLVGAVAVLGPLSGWIPATMDWPMALLYVPAIAMVLSMCLMSLTGGRLQMIGTVGVLLSGIGINVAGGFFIEGMASTLYGVMVAVASIVGWTLQFRLRGGQIEFRARVGTHLVYFYAINFLQRGINLVVGLITADLLNQSLLQAEPLAPGLAQLLGVPELAAGNIDELTDDLRRDLIWSYVFVVLASFGLQFPLRVINPYYNMWIMQRINQDLRIALISRWHQLSLSYHSEHRTGDSIFRIYQDSAMVTAVVGHMIGMTLAMMSYYTCVVLVTILNPWLGLAAGVLVAPALLWAGWAMPRMRVRALVYREATSDVTSTIQESFSSIKLIKAFGTAGRAQKRLEADSVVAFNAAFPNLCDAVGRLIEQSNGLEVSVSWARTRPTPERRTSILFSESDAGTFKEAARTFRAREPRPDVQLFGSVHKLIRGEHEIEGQVTFKMDMDGRTQSVVSVLDQGNYSVAIRAHEARNPVVVRGDLERIGQRWRVTNAAVRELASDDDDVDESV